MSQDDRSRPGNDVTQRKIVALVFTGMLVLYLLTMNGRIYTPDESQRFRLTLALLQGELAIGHAPLAYCKYGLLLPAIAAAAMRAKKILTGNVDPASTLFFALLVNPAVTASLCALLYLTVRGFGYQRATAAVLAVLLGTGTPFWSEGRTLLSEPLTALAVLATYHLLRFGRDDLRLRFPFVAGLALGGAIMERATMGMLAPFFFAYLLVVSRRGKARKAIAFLAGLMLLLASIGWYNDARYGSAFSSAYVTDPVLRGDGPWSGEWRFSLPALCFSPGKGLLVSGPVLLLALIGLPAFAARHRRETVFIALLCAAHILVHASWWCWWSGASFGNRFTLIIVPLLLLPAAEVVQLAARHRRWLVLTLVVAGVSIITQLPAALCTHTWYYCSIAGPRFLNEPEMIYGSRHMPLSLFARLAGETVPVLQPDLLLLARETPSVIRYWQLALVALLLLIVMLVGWSLLRPRGIGLAGTGRQPRFVDNESTRA
ncbi:MAG TPA: glycosyltransferase family 39 protein [bacterium]|nr:glycosyltransferase family 39 protein [bacterium]